MKLSGKIKVLILAVLIFLIAFTALFVNVYKESVNLQERLGNQNMLKWHHIGQMAKTVEKIGITEDGLKETRLYINGMIYSNTENIMPAFNGSGNAHAFLGTYYDSFAATLTDGSLSDEKLAEGLQIFKNMNSELMELSDYVVNKIDNKREKAAELVDYDTEFYKEIEEKIKEFCNKYAKKINSFT